MSNLHEVIVRPVFSSEEQRFQKLMHAYHYLKSLPKISETIWYVATFRDQWVAIFSFSAAALKCSPRDRWIGWSFRHQYDCGSTTLLRNHLQGRQLDICGRHQIACQRSLPSPPPPFFAECAATKPFGNGPTTSANKPEAASGVGIATNATTTAERRIRPIPCNPIRN